MQNKLYDPSLTAAGKHLVVLPIKDETTETGLVLTSEKSYRGEVVSIGTHEEVKALGVKEGDIVYFKPHSGHPIEFINVIHYALDASNILAIQKNV